MVQWHSEMKENRIKKAIHNFEKSCHQQGDTLFLFANKLEKLFVMAYPTGNVQRSLILRQKFEKSIPRSDGKSLNNYMFSLKLQEIPVTWDCMMKWARTRDTFKNEPSSDDDKNKSNGSDIQEISVNVTEHRKEQKHSEVKVKYDPEKKRLYFDDFNELGIEDPSVLMTDENVPENYNNRNYNNNNRGGRPKNYYNSGNHTNNQNREEGRSFYRNKSQYSNSGNPSRFPKVPENGATRCFACNKIGHTKSKCSVAHLHCYVCGKVGHISPACRYRKAPNKYPSNDSDKKKKKEENEGESN